jgi:hypothetical protein
MNDNIPELKIEFEDGSDDGLIVLEQDCGGNVDRVAIHLIHLRYMAEKCDLVVSSDPQAQRAITTLTRRVNLLRDRIDHLSAWLADRLDHHQVDLTYACTYATATADVAAEFCADLDRPHLAKSPDTTAASSEIPEIGAKP